MCIHAHSSDRTDRTDTGLARSGSRRSSSPDRAFVIAITPEGDADTYLVATWAYTAS